ncbi:MAG: hypothetical protein JW781_08820 [Deltaproteobacteria bacterium]|nr:hypothetical protein [Candidatus Anaeroferrophillacea bacterium]
MDKQFHGGETKGIIPKVLPRPFQGRIVGGATATVTGFGVLLFFLSILTLLPAPASATATWFGRYAGPWSHGSHAAIVQTTDGGYATIGDTYSCANHPYCYWGFLTKLSAAGEVQWSHVVGDEERRYTNFSHLAATPDGGVVVAGQTSAGPQLGVDDLLVMKFSSSGTVVWQRVYGAEGLGRASSASPRIYVNDDGTLSITATFYLGGCTDCGCGRNNVYHLKLDGTTGTLMEETVLDGGSYTTGYRGRKVAGGFVTLPTTFYSGTGLNKYTLTLNKFNDSGANQWSKYYFAVDPDDSANLIQFGGADNQSSTEIADGYVLGSKGYDSGYYLFRIGSTGSVQWMKRFDCYADKSSWPAAEIVTTTDGAVLISIKNGFSTVENTILKVNTADGSLLWANRYREVGLPGQNSFTSLTPLAAGYFAACGYARTAVLDSSGNLAQPCDWLEITPCTAEITCSSVTWDERDGSGNNYCGLFPALQSAPCDLIYTSASGFSPTEFCGGDDDGSGDNDDDGDNDDNNNDSGGNSQAYPASPLVPVVMPSSVNPVANPVMVGACPDVIIRPTLQVPAADVGKSATLIMYIYVPAAGFGINIPPQQATLTAVTEFNLVPTALDFSDVGGFSFYVYYGYVIGSQITYSAYAVTVGDTCGSADPGSVPDCGAIASQASCTAVTGCIWQPFPTPACILDCASQTSESACDAAFGGGACQWASSLFGDVCVRNTDNPVDPGDDIEDTCNDCSCPDYAITHPDECGQSANLNFRLTWNDTNDVDIHVVYDSGAISEEVYWSERDGFFSGGELDVDANAACYDLVQHAVENIYFQDPAPGTYTLKVCGYGICDSGSTTAVTAQMIEDGVITWQQQVDVSEWDNNCVEVYTKTVN